MTSEVFTVRLLAEQVTLMFRMTTVHISLQLQDEAALEATQMPQPEAEGGPCQALQSLEEALAFQGQRELERGRNTQQVQTQNRDRNCDYVTRYDSGKVLLHQPNRRGIPPSSVVTMCRCDPAQEARPRDEEQRQAWKQLSVFGRQLLAVTRQGHFSPRSEGCKLVL
ncbi:hypothetical protein TREES_T100016318 [Tupaia chinensis]|uniref:Uncharacterized protein n=1 Tax=Tupaia chinensis TaxID=246437 RepID=L9JCL5_TUPCH|nr:hypothetical protein TREES_T100016318 [Tupaia chinensis]